MLKYCLLLISLSTLISSQDTIKIAYIISGDTDDFHLHNFFVDRNYIYDMLFRKIDNLREISVVQNANTIIVKETRNTDNKINQLPGVLFRYRDIYQKHHNFKYYQYNYLEDVVIQNKQAKITLNKQYSSFRIKNHFLNSPIDRIKKNLVKYNEKLYLKFIPYRNEVDVVNDLDKGNIDFFQYTEIPKFIDLEKRNISKHFRQYQILREDNSWIGLFLNSERLSVKVRSALKKSFNHDFLIKKFSRFSPSKTNSLFSTEKKIYFSRENPVYDPIGVMKNINKNQKPLRLIYPLHSEILAYIAGEITIQLSEVGILVQPLGISLEEYLFRIKAKQYELAISNLFYEDEEYINVFSLLDYYLDFGKNYKKYLRTLEQINQESKFAIIHRLQDIIEKSDKLIPFFILKKQHFLINRKIKKVIETEKKSRLIYFQRIQDLSEWALYGE